MKIKILVLNLVVVFALTFLLLDANDGHAIVKSGWGTADMSKKTIKTKATKHPGTTLPGRPGGAKFTPLVVDKDGDGYASADDCDDTNGFIHPGAYEICDEVDNDCDGDVDELITNTYYADTDGDGYGNVEQTTEACAVPTGYVVMVNDGDCDDGDDTINPGAAETCDSIDNNCDGTVDELCARASSGTDADGDGHNDVIDCDDDDDSIHPGANETCNYVDDDCDGDIDDGIEITCYVDADHDGYGSSTRTVERCECPTGYSEIQGDCDDSDSYVHESAPERCNSTTDYDCDGNTNETTDCFTPGSDPDLDFDGYPASTDCDDRHNASNPGATEVCDGLDNNCDGDVDYNVDFTFFADIDGDGYGDPSLTQNDCTLPTGYAVEPGDCDDNEATTAPDAEEICSDVVDNNCDGNIDEGC
jgi:large repetitive protein